MKNRSEKSGEIKGAPRYRRYRKELESWLPAIGPTLVFGAILLAVTGWLDYAYQIKIHHRVNWEICAVFAPALLIIGIFAIFRYRLYKKAMDKAGRKREERQSLRP